MVMTEDFLCSISVNEKGIGYEDKKLCDSNLLFVKAPKNKFQITKKVQYPNNNVRNCLTQNSFGHWVIGGLVIV